MKKTTKSFSQFRMECEEIYSVFSQHCTWSNLRVWERVPGDILQERECWYCIMKLHDHCNMIVTYDYEENDEKPYVCWYDYSYPCMGCVTYSRWEFETLEDAMHFCMHEPIREWQNRNMIIMISRPTVFKNGYKSWQVINCYSMIEAIDFLNEHKDSEFLPEGDWNIRWHRFGTTPLEGEKFYTIHSGKWDYCGPFSFSSDLNLETEATEYKEKEAAR